MLEVTAGAETDDVATIFVAETVPGAFQFPVVIVPTVVIDVLPASGDAPTVLYEMVTADEPLNVCGLDPPEPLLLIVNEFVAVPKTDHVEPLVPADDEL